MGHTNRPTDRPTGRPTGATALDLLKESLAIHRFPAFCGSTAALFYLLRPVFERLLAAGAAEHRRVWASFCAGAVAGAGGLQLLNCRQKGPLAGRTIDLTLFTLVGPPPPPPPPSHTVSLRRTGQSP